MVGQQAGGHCSSNNHYTTLYLLPPCRCVHVTTDYLCWFVSMFQGTRSRDKERAELLRLHNSLDSAQSQMESQRQELGKDMARLVEENQEMRRAFRRLLQ